MTGTVGRASSHRRVYLDHASTSPLRPEALDAMLPFLRDLHGDPGRVHTEGHVTRVAVETAREQVAAMFGARPREVVFTSGGTEAVNAAVFGAVERALERAGDAGPPHLVTTAVEHSSVLDGCRRAHAETTIVGVDGHGRFDPAAVVDALRPDTALVSIQLANHEVGTIQPAAEVVAACRAGGVLTHVDACAAAGVLPVDFRALDADLCSVTAHTWGGPKGIGALLVRRGLRIPPFVVGGAQERARRAGVENVPAIVGFGAAADAVTPGLEAEAARLALLTRRVLDEGPARIDGLSIYGDPVARLPHLVCLGIDGVEAEPILLGLDQAGIACHSGSSCSSETLEPSPVLEAMGVDGERSLRISVGWPSLPDDIDAVLDALPDVVARLRLLRT